MVERLPFGSSVLYRITAGAWSAEILPYGASVRSLRVPGRDGKAVDVVLGYDTPEEYAAQNGCLGAAVGRYANRIGGAKFTLNGKTYPLFANEGRNTLHSGAAGFHKRLWALSAEGEDTVLCVITSPDGEGGFPGNFRMEVRYTLKGGALSIRYTATSDADTVLNLTNHTYFNLGGQGSGPVDGHLITLRACRYTPIDAEKLPTGELRKVEGTAWDLRSPTLLGERLTHPDLVPTGGFDHNFVLDGPEGNAVFCPATGIRMDFTTDQPGVQLYTAGGLTPRRGKAGAQYAPRHGLCLETQNFPDAVNQPAFPTPVLKAGEVFHSETVYRFSLT